MVPPLTVNVIEPVEAPLQSTFTCVLLRLGPLVLLIVAEVVFVQALASVTVTVYVPAARPLISWVVALFDQLYVYGETPPLTVKSMEPFGLPQVEFTVVVLNTTADGCVMVADVVFVQAFASVTVTVYVPAARPVRFCVVIPPPQL